ncbi:MAG: Holliday junction resolvase RuvX [Anaerolineae bacterium]
MNNTDQQDSENDFLPWLGIDLGEKRIGIALSDGLKIAAQPHSTIQRTSRKADFEKFGKLAKEHNVSLLVIGLPLHLNGDEGAMAKWARDYGGALGEALGVPVVFQDESLTSEMAAGAMAEAGYSRKKMKGKLDAVAAALILQSYMDAIKNDW